jgi:hypothetical protein
MDKESKGMLGKVKIRIRKKRKQDFSLAIRMEQIMK